MGDVGQLLQEARQQKGVSLEQVEEATRIRQKFLKALEEEDYTALPAEAYVKGFLRNYALYLGLDPEEVLALYEGRDVKGKAASAKPGFFEPMDISLAAPSWLTPDLVIGALLIVALLAFGSWAAWHYLPPIVRARLSSGRAIATATPSPTVTTSEEIILPPATSTATPTTMPTAMPIEMPTATSTAMPTVAVVVSPTSTSTPTSVPTRTSAPTGTLTPRVSAGVEVELRIVEYSWLRVVVDGQEVFAGSLEEGTTHTWRGRESIALRCGNAGGVEATVNGEPLGLLGERGKVVDVEWFVEGVTPTPTPPEATATPTITPTAAP
ncbi:MAG: RodZ domain-containing protein [Anaerolineae bacterium]